MYGAGGDNAKTEQADVNPLTAYARSKIETEKGLKLLADDKFKVTCLRFATACGMSDRLRLDLVLNDFVACALAAKKITVLSDGTPWRPLIHVQDMARAIDWAVGRELEAGGACLIVNTGIDSWNYQVKELAEAVVDTLENPSEIVWDGTQSVGDKKRVLDTSRAKSIGFSPQVALQEGIWRTIEWYRANKKQLDTT